MNPVQITDLLELARKEFGCAIHYSHYLKQPSAAQYMARLIQIQPQNGFGVTIELCPHTGIMIRIAASHNAHSDAGSPSAIKWQNTITQIFQSQTPVHIAPELAKDGCSRSFPVHIPIA